MKLHQVFTLVILISSLNNINSSIEKFNTARDKEFVANLLDHERQWLPDEGDIKDLEEGDFEIDFKIFKAPITNKTIYLYFVDNKPIGFISFWMIHNTGQILRLAILPEYRRKGYAKELVLYAIEAMRFKGAQVIMIETLPENIIAQNLYEKLGFEKSDLYGHIMYNMALK